MRLRFQRFVTLKFRSGAIALTLGWGFLVMIGHGLAQESAPAAINSQAILNYVNEWRVKAGRPPLLWFQLIDQAALAHSQYLWDAHNGTISHSESNRASPYFRGQQPADRVKLLYPQAQAVGEVLGSSMGGSDAIGVIKNLFDAPFHRVGLLANFKSAGAAAAYRPKSWGSNGANDPSNAEGVISTVNMVDQADATPEAKFVVWPFAGQNDVVLDWYDFESPSPVPLQYYGKLFGYPISIQTPKFDQKLRNVKFTVTDKTGHKVTSDKPQDGVMNYSSEINGFYQDRDYAIFVPSRPWLKNTVYNVTATGLVDGVPFTAHWQFATTGAQNLTANIYPNPNKKIFAAGEEFDVALSGGTGNYHVAQDKHSFEMSYKAYSDQKGKAVEFKAINSQKYHFRNLCNSLRPCQMQFTFYDSASRVTLNLEFLGQ